MTDTTHTAVPLDSRVEPPAAAPISRLTPRYVLPELPYLPAALEPYCLAEAVVIHHDRHHAAYVAGANKTIEQLEVARSSNDWSRINQLEADLAFHVSGHLLHSIFWTNLTPNSYDRPVGELADAIADSFGSFDAFREQFTRVALGVQGSGWAALAWEPLGKCLVVEQIHDHQSGIAQGSKLLLVCDVWEHAYYLQYSYGRAGWVDAFWHIVNWPDVEERFAC